MKTKRITGLLVLGALLCGLSVSAETNKDKLNRLYSDAIKDAAIAKAEEIYPLVEVTKDSPYMIWNEAGDKVLMQCYTKHYDWFPTGSVYTTTPDYEIWLASGKEFEQWYKVNGKDVDDWTLRLEQLIGLPPEYGATHFVGFWVKPEDLVRPAYQSNPTKQIKPEDFKGDSLGDNALWFLGNISYFHKTKMYPWTKLGYTYDWSDKRKSAYGLSEFLVKPGAKLESAWVKTTEEYINSLK